MDELQLIFQIILMTFLVLTTLVALWLINITLKIIREIRRIWSGGPIMADQIVMNEVDQYRRKKKRYDF